MLVSVTSSAVIRGPLIGLRYFHQDMIRWCSMHTINLGLCYGTNGSALIPAGSWWSCHAGVNEETFVFGNNRSYRILCDPWYPKDGSCRKFLFWRLSARDPSEPAWWSIYSVQKLLQTKQNCMQSTTFHYEIGSLLSRVGHMFSIVLMLGCNGCSDFTPDRDAHFPNLGAQGPEWTKADSEGVLWPCYYGMAIPCFGMCCCWAFEWQWWSSIECSHCDACSRLAKSCLCRTRVWTKIQVVVCKANMRIPHHTTHMHAQHFVTRRLAHSQECTRTFFWSLGEIWTLFDSWPNFCLQKNVACNDWSTCWKEWMTDQVFFPA